MLAPGKPARVIPGFFLFGASGWVVLKCDPMTPEEHRQEHIRLHRALDELLACYFSENMDVPLIDTPGRTMVGTKSPLMDFLVWSHQKTMVPTSAEREDYQHPRSQEDYESQRQLICLALAELALSRPGFESAIKEIARHYDAESLPTFESLKRSNADRVKVR